MTKFSPERRQWPRFVPTGTISVSIFQKGAQTFGSIADVSEEGARVVAGVRFQPGAQVLLRICFDPQGDPFTTAAEVMWSREDSESEEKAMYLHGVKLHITEEEQRSQLRSILSRPDFQKDEY